jgi:hypothetical protein
MENKLYLDNGEVMDLDVCGACKKTYIPAEPKEEDLEKYQSLVSRVMDKSEIISLKNEPTISFRSCDCGTYPDITLNIKYKNG